MIEKITLGKPDGGSIPMLFELHPEQFFSDAALLHYFHRQQMPEPEVVAVMMRALRAGSVAVDAGANIGFFTVLMSKLVGKEGKVIAIEPDGRNAAKLRKNLDINECANVDIVEAPLLDKEMKVPFYEMAENGTSAIVPPFGVESQLEPNFKMSTTFDKVLAGRQPRFLKMDIEGAEATAIGACDYMFSIVVSEVNDEALRRFGCSGQLFVDQMRDCGQCAYVLHPDGSLPSAVAPEHDLVFTRQNSNMLFTRPKYLRQMWTKVEV